VRNFQYNKYNELTGRGLTTVALPADQLSLSWSSSINIWNMKWLYEIWNKRYQLRRKQVQLFSAILFSYHTTVYRRVNCKVISYCCYCSLRLVIYILKWVIIFKFKYFPRPPSWIKTLRGETKRAKAGGDGMGSWDGRKRRKWEGKGQPLKGKVE